LEVEPEGDDANVKPTLANTISWSDDGRLLATTRSGQVQLWKVQDDMIVPIELKIPETLFPEDLAINDLDFSADGTLLVAGGAYDEEAYGLVWKIENDMATPVASIEAEDRHTGAKGVTAVVINDATSEVITGGADSRIQRWQLGGTQNDDLTELPWIIESEGRGPGSTDGFRNPHEKAITSLDTASDGRFVSTDDDGWIVIWPSKQ
jgi:WD40 repeat protein